MGNDISKSQRSTRKNTKQSKKWTKFIPKREKSETISLDLDITDPIMIESPVMSWNCHRKLENIKQNLLSVQSNVDRIKSDNTSISFKQQHNLSQELNFVGRNISKTIQGITHNYLDGLPNERALLDYWSTNSNDDDNNGNAVIVFEIAEMDKIHQTLGWESGDNIIIETGKKIQEYCTWYSSDYDVQFKLFHPDFALNEFIVVTACSHAGVIEDLCECILIDVERSVKCFFQQTTVWVGYVLNLNLKTKPKSKLITTHDIGYDFRLWYEKSKTALKEAMKISKFVEKPSDRIRKWLSPEEKLKKGNKISQIIHSYISNHIRYGNNNSYNTNNEAEIMDIDEAIQEIDKEMKTGADLNYCDMVGHTPFFYALLSKENELIRYLLQYEFDMDHRDKSGRIVLIEALRNNISESICCIIAERIKYPNIPDNSNITPFVWSLNCGYFKVMNILSKKGCMDYKNWIISSCIKDQEIILCDIIRDNGIRFESKLDNIGRSILHYAVLHKAYKIITICLKNRYIHVDIVDNNGWSPLHYASAKNYTKCILLLIDYDADIFLKTEENLYPIDIAKKFKKKEAELLLANYQIERREKFQRFKFQLPISNQSESESSSNKKMEPIRIILSQENKDDVEYDWNKENEDINIPESSRSRRISDSKSQSQSQSQSQPSSNSENIYKPSHKTFKKPNISIIDENEYVNKLLSDDNYNESEESDESNQTRVIHASFSDEIERALINYNCNKGKNSKNNDDDDEKDDISDNSISNQWNDNYLNENV